MGEFIRVISGDMEGQLMSGQDTATNFDVVSDLEKGGVPIIIIGSREVHFKFWSGSTPKNQYINMLPKGGFKVTEDTDVINEITGNNLRITVDGGGEKRDTLHIYIQIYDV